MFLDSLGMTLSQRLRMLKSPTVQDIMFKKKIRMKYKDCYKFKMYEVKLDKHCLMHEIIVNNIIYLFKEMAIIFVYL